MAVSRRTVTVVFADVADSTPLGERVDPESVRRVMSRFFEQMSEVLERHGGTVEKFIGDAVMAVFGIPELHEDDALRAVRAATELRAALAALNAELEHEFGVHIGIRVGVNSGEVVAGDGSGGHMLVTGDPVNVAKRLEESARTGEILIGEPTRKLVENAAVYEPRDELQLKGKSSSVLAWNVLATIEGAPAYARRLDAPLVGRQRELQMLRSVFDDALAGRKCRLVTIMGPAGIGKSRLAAELASSVGSEARVLSGTCLPYGEGITFWPIGLIIGGLGGEVGLRATLAGAEDAELVADRVLGAVSPTPVSGPGGELFWAFRRLFEEVARDEPLVLVIEDIHWAEPRLLDLLEYLAGWTDDAPILLVCLARPEVLEERPGWLSAADGASLLLGPLSEAESETLLTEIGREWPLDAAARARITEAAEGNPLYVEQMAAMLAEGKTLDAIPPSVHALLAARLDRLSPEQRGVLERAAVAGKDFTRRLVLGLSPEEEHGEVDATLLDLVRRDFLSARPGREDNYRFRHVLIRDAAYAGIPKELRAQLHERFAGLAERTQSGRAGEIDEIIGYHLEQAFLYRKALGPLSDDDRVLAGRARELLTAAGRRAMERGDSPAAANLLGRALALTPDDVEERLVLMIELSEALTGTGALAEAQRLLDEATAAAEAAGDPRMRARASLEASFTRLHTWDGGLDDFLPQSDEAVAVFEAAGDDEGLSRALMLRAYITFIRCRIAETEQIVDRALAHAMQTSGKRLVPELLHVRARAALRGPTPVTAAMEWCEGIRAQSGGDQALDAFMRSEIAVLEAMLGHFDHARELSEAAQEILLDLGRTLAVALVRAEAGAVELLAGDTAAAARCLRPACDTMQEIGERGMLSTYSALLADALSDQGLDDSADTYARLSEETALGEDVLSQVLWRNARARLLRREAALEDAGTLAKEAVGMAADTDDLNLLGYALSGLGGVLVSARREPEASAAYAQAAEVFRRKGNVVAGARVEERANVLAIGT
jgi:class 3 adenylate cyclase/tetratricopeptide (TPR) repeat protein